MEGFKRAPLPKIEVYRAVVGKPPLHAQDPGVALVASDDPCPEARVPVLSPDDLPALADAVWAAARAAGRGCRQPWRRC